MDISMQQQRHLSNKKNPYSKPHFKLFISFVSMMAYTSAQIFYIQVSLYDFSDKLNLNPAQKLRQAGTEKLSAYQKHVCMCGCASLRPGGSLDDDDEECC